MNRTTSVERRVAPRVDARLPLQLTEPDSRLVVTTESVDLSRGGIGCRTSEYVAPLSKVALTIILPPFGTLSRAPRSLRAEGVVVRCEPAGAGVEPATDAEYDVACCFTSLEPDAKNLLDAFVAWRLLRSVRVTEERGAHLRAPGRTAPGPRSGGHGPRRGAPTASGGHPRAHAGAGGDRRHKRYPGAKPGGDATHRGRRSDSPRGHHDATRGERGYTSASGPGSPPGRRPGRGPRKGPRREDSRRPGAARGGPRDRSGYRRGEERRAPETAPVGAARAADETEDRRQRWGRRPTRRPSPPGTDRGPSSDGQDGSA